ncbi:hypothetical protein CEB3_c46110 [Peptococcaceae bacterium CEB3]|nr:hypothetical protein CEB3_c46110 [Peptococcaceae bacterium CEB3]
MTSLPSTYFGLFYPYNILIAIILVILFRILIWLYFPPQERRT